MSWFAAYVRSSIGAKHVMAVTGLGLLGFALFHMVGHLGMFGGPDVFNGYAHTLQSLGAIKWLARAGLLAIFVVHLATGVRLALLNRAARPVAYVAYKTRVTSLAARTMAITGLGLFVFLGFHIAHFTLGWVQPDTFGHLDSQGRHDAYAMFVAGFRNVPIYLVYLAAILIMSSHLGHGAVSWLQSLGLRHPKYTPLVGALGSAITVVLFLGYMAPPTAVLLGLVGRGGA